MQTPRKLARRIIRMPMLVVVIIAQGVGTKVNEPLLQSSREAEIHLQIALMQSREWPVV